MTDLNDMVTISSNSSFEADMTKMYLELRDITVFLPDQYIGATAPHLASFGGAGAVRIQVPRHQVKEAKRLLSERKNQ
jgi:hypothetical protein